MDTPEYIYSDGIELRQSDPGDDSPGTATGYAVQWGLKSPPIYIGPNKRITETVNRGAFDKGEPGHHVLMVGGHDEHKVTGASDVGTLKLTDDGIGLRYENKLPNTTLGRDMAVDIARGNIRGTSIAYIPRDKGVEWNFNEEPPHRSINAATLYHISYSSRPAHSGTSTTLRSLDLALAARDATPPPADPSPPANDNAVSEHLLARLRLAELGL